MVKRVTGEVTTETLTIIIGGDTTTCALYEDDSLKRRSNRNYEGFLIFGFNLPILRLLEDSNQVYNLI